MIIYAFKEIKQILSVCLLDKKVRLQNKPSSLYLFGFISKHLDQRSKILFKGIVKEKIYHIDNKHTDHK